MFHCQSNASKGHMHSGMLNKTPLLLSGLMVDKPFQYIKATDLEKQEYELLDFNRLVKKYKEAPTIRRDVSKVLQLLTSNLFSSLEKTTRRTGSRFSAKHASSKFVFCFAPNPLPCLSGELCLKITSKNSSEHLPPCKQIMSTIIPQFYIGKPWIACS